MRYGWIYIVLLGAALETCKKPYDPPQITSPNQYLVVEGVINNGPDSTIFQLSRTVNLSSKNTRNPVLGATLAVESDQGTIIPLTEVGNGEYGAASLTLDNAHKYRLRMSVSGERYLSDFVPVIDAPPIDSVGFSIQNNGITINVGTHDPQNNTHYYRWDYRETWIFHSNYFSGYVSNGDTVIERNLATQNVYQCWGNDTSSNIVLASTALLSKDIVTNNPVTSIASTSEKLGTKYSILVREYGLSGDAFSFWQNLKTTSESLGGIFDPQPSQINGNIHSVSDPGETVIGYVSAGRVTSKRIFISNTQLPGWLPANPYPDCELDSLYIHYKPPGSLITINQEDLYFNIDKEALAKNALIPVQAIIQVAPITHTAVIIGHSGSTPECVDCTIRGTNKQPAFWK